MPWWAWLIIGIIGGGLVTAAAAYAFLIWMATSGR